MIVLDLMEEHQYEDSSLSLVHSHPVNLLQYIIQASRWH